MGAFHASRASRAFFGQIAQLPCIWKRTELSITLVAKRVGFLWLCNWNNGIYDFRTFQFKRDILIFLEENHFCHFNQERRLRTQAVTYFVGNGKWRYKFIRLIKGGSYFLLILNKRFFTNMHALVLGFFLLESFW